MKQIKRTMDISSKTISGEITTKAMHIYEMMFYLFIDLTNQKKHTYIFTRDSRLYAYLCTLCRIFHGKGDEVLIIESDVY